MRLQRQKFGASGDEVERLREARINRHLRWRHGRPLIDERIKGKKPNIVRQEMPHRARTAADVKDSARHPDVVIDRGVCLDLSAIVLNRIPVPILVIRLTGGPGIEANRVRQVAPRIDSAVCDSDGLRPRWQLRERIGEDIEDPLFKRVAHSQILPNTPQQRTRIKQRLLVNSSAAETDFGWTPLLA